MAVTKSNDSPTKNFAVISPLHKHASSNTLSEGNRVLSTSTNGWFGAVGSVAIRYGEKRYFEAKCLTNVRIYFGLSRVLNHNGQDIADSAVVEGSANFDYMWRTTSDNEVYYQGSNQSATVSAVSVNDIVSCTTETNGTVKFYKNGTLIHTFSTTLTDGHVYYPIFSVNGATSTERVQANFGTGDVTQQESGYSLLTAADMLSLDGAPAIEDGSAFFQTIAEWTGNASSQTVTQTGNSGFTPDWAIIKSRSFGNGANSFDSVRGGSKGLATFDSGVEDDQADGVVFSSSGGKGTLAFTGSGDTGDINHTGRTYLAWTWLAGGAPTTDNISNGGSPGQTPTNNSVFRDGAASTTAFGSATIYPTRASINTTCGLSIIEYVGTGSNATLAHGLGAVPKMAWFRNRESAGNNWVVYHSSATGNTHHTNLDNTNAQAAGDRFQDTDPTNEVFSVDGTTDINKSTDEHVAYIFAEVPGFSRFGFFEGNGSSANGPFIELGFKPAWFMWKNVDSSTNGNWTVMDSGRDPFNMVENNLRMDTADAQDTGEADLDFLSNGVRHRGGTSERFNTDNQTYLYAAFAEHPFAGSTPATAR